MSGITPAKRLDDIPEYVFSRLGKTVKEVERSSGRPVMNFGIGSPDVPPSQIYSQKLAELVQAPNAHVYPGYGATEELAQALIGWYNQRFGVTLTKDELLSLNGAKDGISHLPLALLNQGDEVLVPDPGYPSFSSPAALVGAKPIPYSLIEANDFKIDLSELEQKLSPRTKFIWINFPSNPTGQVITGEELEAVVGFAREHGLFILYDNAYSEITFGDSPAPSILQIEGAKDIAVEFGSFSKAFSFAGLRMGWVAGNSSAIDALAKLKSQMDSGLSLPLQGLAAYALNHPDQSWHGQMISSYVRRRDIIAERIKALGLSFTLPAGGLYIWAKLPAGAGTSEAFCESLLKNKQILLAPGSAFGKNGEGYVRVSICVNIDNINNYF
jgi:LL-diaminopimelate aminotransferase